MKIIDIWFESFSTLIISFNWIAIIAICLLMALLAVLTAGCSNANTGTIDPNAVEHNPNQPMNPLPEDGEKNGGADEKADGKVVEAADSASEGQKENNGNSGHDEASGNTGAGTGDICC